MKRIIGLDIGGANLKASDGEAQSISIPFPLWKQPERLPEALAELITRFAATDTLAVTMTGELADCYATKSEGVADILAAVEQAAADTPVGVWQTSGEFVEPEVAREFWMLTAAANWHALATLAGRIAPTGAALLIDIGSTTTDIVPLVDCLPMPAGRTDLERLQCGELVYSGVKRTPVCAIAHSVPFGADHCPLAAELFATTHDVYLLTGDIPEDADDTGTADGRPATIECARDRLTRMLCADRSEVSLDEITDVARFLADVHRQRLAGALQRVLRCLPGTCGSVLTSGEGEFLARRLVADSPALKDATFLSLAEMLGDEHSQAACAYALARLGSERLA
ncbi:Hydantoinase/oxoprolinase [Maioricimonas rarisocia]|uniref:Hydantoinase/oxoprolinase n=1 Tax=Maioricimonas rarisocia TaxID=2528026 RepID=A0A517Z399_9PLAN|nr:hydantoinase/oxoprolinase family protein [Maioricimonas rarisocia]QDU36916.1 Hydantoinase/oxoprolinase [Maioricimonas rarisocia]